MKFFVSQQNRGFCIPILYDGKLTLESNLQNAILKIDNEILRNFKKEGNWKCLEKRKQ